MHSAFVCAISVYVKQESKNHAKCLLNFCFQVMETYNANKLYFRCAENNTFVTKALDVKIGLHCGPVTGAVIGRSRAFFRLFGDTVNAASRIGGAAKGGQIVGTKEFYQELTRKQNQSQLQECHLPKFDDPSISYETSYLGKVFLKGKGLKSYFLFVGTSTDLSIRDSLDFETISNSKVSIDVDSKAEEHAVVDTDIETNHKFWNMGNSHNEEANNNNANTCSMERSFGSKFTATIQHNEPSEDAKELRKSQQLIASASRLLEIPLARALDEYKTLPQGWSSIHNAQCIKRIERLVIREFVQSRLRNKRKARTKVFSKNPKGLKVTFSSGKVKPPSMNEEKKSKCSDSKIFNPSMNNGMNSTCSDGDTDAETDQKTDFIETKATSDITVQPSHTYMSVYYGPPAALSHSSEDNPPWPAHATNVSQAFSMDGLFLPIHTSSKPSHITTCLYDCQKYMRLIQTQFSDDALEHMYETKRIASCFLTVEWLSSYILSVLFIFIALYYHLLKGEGIWLAVLGGIFGISLFLGNSTLKRFRVAEKMAIDRGGVDPQVESKQRPSNIDNLTRHVFKSEEISCMDASTVQNLDGGGTNTKSFAHWMVAVILLFASILLCLDQLLMRQSERDRGCQEICLRSFILPTFLLAVVHIFGLSTRAQIITQSGIILMYLILFSARELLLDCNGYIQTLGFMCLLVVAVNSVTESGDSEVRSRLSLVAQLASKKANDKADSVANRLFPPYVTETLKKDKPIPFEDVHNDVVILWADLVGFTALSSTLDSFEVMQMLDELYSNFDDEVEKKSMWKMDTIGDAYIIIGGLVDDLGVKSSILVDRMFSLGVKMLGHIRDFNDKHNSDISMRVGIHAGQVGSGIAGKLRPRYYVFGENVLYAEYMESTGKPGCIHASKAATEMYRESQFSLGPEGSGNEIDDGSCWIEN